jgi:predicted small lipoprotein YifL
LTQSIRPIFRLAGFGVLILALLLVGCGRKGPLDLPPAEVSQQPGQSGDTQSGSSTGSSSRNSPQMEYSVEGRPLAPRGQKKKLPADILLD